MAVGSGAAKANTRDISACNQRSREKRHWDPKNQAPYLFRAHRVGGELFDEVLGDVLDLAIQHGRAAEREHRVQTRHQAVRRVEQQHETLDGPRVDACLHGAK